MPKYDLEAMQYEPFESEWAAQFLWYDTPQGYKFWHSQYTNNNGLTEEAIAALDEMKAQWEQEQKERQL